MKSVIGFLILSERHGKILKLWALLSQLTKREREEKVDRIRIEVCLWDIWQKLDIHSQHVHQNLSPEFYSRKLFRNLKPLKQLRFLKLST